MTGTGHVRIGLLGGSFNPVHTGHVQAARAVREALALDAVLLMPAAAPPHKAAGALAPACHRLAMVRLAVAGVPGLGVETCELERGGTSYAIDTVRELQARHPDWDLHFIVGMDALRELHLWRSAADLVAACRIVPLERPGVDRPLDAGELALPAPWPKRLMDAVLPGPRVDASSSDVRSRVAAGCEIGYLVPAVVACYIAAFGLYRPHPTIGNRHA